MEAVAKEWWVVRDREKSGPYSPDELKAQARGGELLADDLIWKPGLKSPVPVRAVRMLQQPSEQQPSPIVAEDPYRSPTAPVREEKTEQGNALLRVEHPDFETQVLELRKGALWRGPRLLLNGRQLKWQRVYNVIDDRGVECTVKLGYVLLDPIPSVTVDGLRIPVAPALQWYEYLWIGLPLLLLLIGGAIGGFCGAVAAYGSGSVFRSRFSVPMKFLISAGISVAAVFVYLMLAVVLELALQGRH